MPSSAPFKWRHLQADLLRCAVRWCLRSAVSSRDVEERLREGAGWGDHTPVFRGVQRDAPELDQRGRPSRRVTKAASRGDDTCIQIKQPRRPICSDKASMCIMWWTTIIEV